MVPNSQELSKSRRQGDKGSASVQNGTGFVKLCDVIAKGNRVKVNLPVRLPAKRDLDQITSEVISVDTTEGGHRVITFGVGISKIEGKNRLIKQFLVQHVVERGNDLVDRDGVISQSQNAIESAESKGKTGLTGRFRKILILDFQIANLKNILRDKATQATGSIADGELGAVLLVGTRGRGVILAVQVACDGSTLRRRHPEVGAAGVEHDLEALRGGTQGDFGEVCEVGV